MCWSLLIHVNLLHSIPCHTNTHTQMTTINPTAPHYKNLHIFREYFCMLETIHFTSHTHTHTHRTKWNVFRSRPVCVYFFYVSSRYKYLPCLCTFVTPAADISTWIPAVKLSHIAHVLQQFPLQMGPMENCSVKSLYTMALCTSSRESHDAEHFPPSCHAESINCFLFNSGFFWWNN